MRKRITALLMAAVMAAASESPTVMAAQTDNGAKPLTVTEIQTAASDPAASASEPQLPAKAAETAANSSGSKIIDLTARGQGYREWETDIRLQIRNEFQMIQDAGMTQDEWDLAAAQGKQEGLASPVTEEMIRSADENAQILSNEFGQIYYISGNGVFDTISGPMDAFRLVYSLIPLFGGTQEITILPWSALHMNDTTVYSFQQIADSKMLLGSTVKVAVNQDGTVSAVFNALDPESMNKTQNFISREQAEGKADEHLKAEGIETGVLSQYTHRIHRYPEGMEDALNLDEQTDESIPDQILWTVYSENTSEGKNAYPYLAHYVTLDGMYKFSMPVREPQDKDALYGYHRQEVFDGMEADTWTGEITNMNGETRTVTIPVMKNAADGLYYLGDTERKIAVADFAEAAYGENHELKLVSSEKNDDWDPEDVFLYSNYIRAWDFYADMGWIGPDGQGTEVVILKNLCTSDGTPYENACSIGLLEGYQMFGYTAYTASGELLGLVQSLDVLGHEYTHTFTANVMNTNLYENDCGAINEAMSDIMGNLIEYIAEDTSDTRWLIGENTGSVIRSMSNPEDYSQPDYVWGQFYGPHTDNPLTANDRGGVHVNSSLLNRIAAQLCLEKGMSYEDAVRFWVMTAMGMTPRTDYQQSADLMRWAMDQSDLETYKDGLNRLIAEEHLERTQIPDKLPAGQKIVRLQIPDTEAFQDGGWAMAAIHLNMEAVGNLGGSLVEVLMTALTSENPAQQALQIGVILQKLVNDLHLENAKIKLDNLQNEDEVIDALTEISLYSLQKLFRQQLSWEAAGTGEMVMVTDSDPTIYLLMHPNASGTKVDGMALLLGKHWYDLSAFGTDAHMSGDIEDGTSPVDEDEMQKQLTELVINLLTDLFAEKEEEPEPDKGMDIESILDTALGLAEYFMADEDNRPSPDDIFVVPARTEYLPTEGLENVKLAEL